MKAMHVLLPSLMALGILWCHSLSHPALASSPGNPMVGSWDLSPPMNCEQIDRAFYPDGEFIVFKNGEVVGEGLYTYTDHVTLITLSYRAYDFEVTMVEDGQEKNVPMSGKRNFFFFWDMGIRAAEGNGYKRKNLAGKFMPYEDVTINIEFSEQQKMERDYVKCGDSLPPRQTAAGFEQLLGAWDIDSNCRFPEFLFLSDGKVVSGYLSNRERGYTDLSVGTWDLDGNSLKITTNSRYGDADSEWNLELEIRSRDQNSMVVESQFELHKTAESNFHVISLRGVGDSKEETNRFLGQYIQKHEVNPADPRNHFVFGDWPNERTLKRCF